MENRFYTLTKKEKNGFLLKLGGLALAINVILAIGLLTIDLTLFPLCIFILVITLSLIAPFYDVPPLVQKGHLTYQSLFLLTEKEKQGVIKIHGGTLFDYYFVLNDEMSGEERTNLILSEYLKGLLNLINNEQEDILIRGTSYIINERTAQKVGLKKVNTDLVQTLILVFNYFQFDRVTL